MTLKEIILKYVTKSDMSGSDKVEKSIKGIKKESKKAGEASESFTGKLKKGLKAGINPAQMLVGKILALGVALIRVTKDWVVFQIQMGRGFTMMNGGIKEWRGFRQQVQLLSNDLGILKGELAGGFYQALSKGIPEDNIISFLRTAGKVAVADGSTVTTAVDGITTILNAFHIEAARADAVADALFNTVKNGGTTFGELAASISQVAPAASAGNVELEQITGAVATLTKGGTPTAQAMTQIRAAIFGLNKVLGDGWGETMSLQEALLKVEKQAGGSQVQLLKLLGTTEAVMGVLGMTGKNAKGAADDLKTMETTTGSLDEAYNKMQGFRHWARLGTTLKTVLFGLGSVIDAVLKPAVIGLTWAVDKVTRGFMLVTGQLPKTKKEADALADSVKANMLPALTDAEKAAKDLGTELTGVSKQDMKGASAGVGKLTDRVDDLSESAKKARSNMAALEDAELGLQLAEIDLKVATGEMTKEQGELAKIEAERAAAQKRFTKEETAAQQKRDAAEKEMHSADVKVQVRKGGFDRIREERRRMEAGAGSVDSESYAGKKFFQELKTTQGADEGLEKHYQEALAEQEELRKKNSAIISEQDQKLKLLKVERQVMSVSAKANRITIETDVKTKAEEKKNKAEKERTEASLREQLDQAQASLKSQKSFAGGGVDDIRGDVAQKRSAAYTASRALEAFEGQSSMDKGAGGLAQHRKLQANAKAASQELDSAMANLDALVSTLPQTIGFLSQKIKNLESQIKRLDV